MQKEKIDNFDDYSSYDGYEVSGSLALERMERRSAERERDYEQDVKVMRKKKARRKYKLRVKSGVYIMAAFALVFYLLYRQSVLQAGNIEINALKKQLKEYQEVTAQLTLEMSAMEDVGDIAAQAYTKFNMAVPEPEQIVAVRLPEIPRRDAGTETQSAAAGVLESNTMAAKSSGFSLSAVVDFFTGLFN